MGCCGNRGFISESIALARRKLERQRCCPSPIVPLCCSLPGVSSPSTFDTNATGYLDTFSQQQIFGAGTATASQLTNGALQLVSDPSTAIARFTNSPDLINPYTDEFSLCFDIDTTALTGVVDIGLQVPATSNRFEIEGGPLAGPNWNLVASAFAGGPPGTIGPFVAGPTTFKLSHLPGDPIGTYHVQMNGGPDMTFSFTLNRIPNTLLPVIVFMGSNNTSQSTITSNQFCASWLNEAQCCSIEGVPDSTTRIIQDNFDGSSLSALWTNLSVPPGSVSVSGGILTVSSGTGGQGRIFNGSLGINPSNDDWQVCTTAQFPNTDGVTDTGGFIGINNFNAPFTPNAVGIVVEPFGGLPFFAVYSNNGAATRTSTGIPWSPGFHTFILRHLHTDPATQVEFSFDGGAFIPLTIPNLPGPPTSGTIWSVTDNTDRTLLVDQYCLRTRSFPG